jgi:hypothetical protein
MAHELAHVQQQRGAALSTAPMRKAELGEDDPALEADADQAAVGAMTRLYAGAGKLVDRARASLKSGANLQACRGRQPMPQGSATPAGTVAHQTPTQVDDELRNSTALRTWLSGRFANGAGAAVGHTHFLTDAEFVQAWRIYATGKSGPGGVVYTDANVDAAGRGINAFQDNGELYVHRDRGQVDTVLHETMHRLADPSFVSTLGFEVNEGSNTYFTRVVLGEQGLPLEASYPDERGAVDRLVAVAGVGQPTLGNAFFNGNIGGLRSAFDATKGAGKFDEWVGFMRARDFANANLRT